MIRSAEQNHTDNGRNVQDIFEILTEKKQCSAKGPGRDLAGMRFGRLTVIAAAGRINPPKTENY